MIMTTTFIFDCFCFNKKKLLDLFILKHHQLIFNTCYYLSFILKKKELIIFYISNLENKKSCECVIYDTIT